MWSLITNYIWRKYVWSRISSEIANSKNIIYMYVNHGSTFWAESSICCLATKWHFLITCIDTRTHKWLTSSLICWISPFRNILCWTSFRIVNLSFTLELDACAVRILEVISLCSFSSRCNTFIRWLISSSLKEKSHSCWMKYQAI